MIQNFDDTPLPTLKNKSMDIPINNNNQGAKGIDDIPIGGNNKLNFNELLEKELSKEGNFDMYSQNAPQAEPKFKYVPKKKVEPISAPTNTKKYKYYSDNFKKKTKSSSNNTNSKKVNLEENNNNKQYKKDKKEEEHVEYKATPINKVMDFNDFSKKLNNKGS